jgi:hypothetical protein
MKMIKHAARNLVLASTLLALTMHAGRTFAQSTTTTATVPAPTPTSVGGTDPEPQGTIVVIILQLLQLA